ncbi:hypothetical protein [Roseovarius sp. MMSF_3281]|nr:hypothetical protein [Roseovarius sp. MMSF_3281]
MTKGQREVQRKLQILRHAEKISHAALIIRYHLMEARRAWKATASVA